MTNVPYSNTRKSNALSSADPKVEYSTLIANKKKKRIRSRYKHFSSTEPTTRALPMQHFPSRTRHIPKRRSAVKSRDRAKLKLHALDELALGAVRSEKSKRTQVNPKRHSALEHFR